LPPPAKRWRKYVDLVAFRGLAPAFGLRRHIPVPRY